MTMEYITIEGKNYRRVNRRKAQKLFESGERVLAYPVNANPYSPWNSPCVFEKEDESDTFDKHDNAFRYYNCGYAEMGYYPKYYVEEGVA